MTINALDGGAYWDMGEGDKSKDLELTIIPYSSKFDPELPDPVVRLVRRSAIWNWQRWKSPEFDKLHDEAGSITDPAERAKKYIRMQQLLDESASCIWITHGVHDFAHAKSAGSRDPAERQQLAVSLLQAGVSARRVDSVTAKAPLPLPRRKGPPDSCLRSASFIAQRLAAALLTLAGAILFLFVIIQFVPGDLVSILLGPRATPELRADFARAHGPRPLDPGAGSGCSSAARCTGDLGTDVISNRPILDMILEVLPNTLQLAGCALLISRWCFGIALGCIAALKPGSLLDTVLGVTSVAFITTPAFVVAIFLLLIFSLQLHWLPVTGAGDPGDPLDRLSHLVLPATALVHRLGRLSRAPDPRLAAGGAVRAACAHDARLWRAGRADRAPFRAAPGAGADDRRHGHRHRRHDQQRGLRRDHLRPARHRHADLQRHPEPQLSRSSRPASCSPSSPTSPANLLVDLLNALLDPRIARSLKQAA